MSENEKKPLLHPKVVAGKNAELPAESDAPRFQMMDTPWGPLSRL
jgi:hypothetical protein